MYALIWILRSIDSQWFSWAHHTVTEFLEAAEQHPRRPAPPQDHEQCLQGMLRMQVQLLQRCKWHMALDWHRDVSPAVHLLATCPARSIFHWLCNLSQAHLAPITPASSEAAKAAIPRSTPAHSRKSLPQSDEPRDLQDNMQCHAYGCDPHAQQNVQSGQQKAHHPMPSFPLCNPGAAKQDARRSSFRGSRQALVDITSINNQCSGLNGSYWNRGASRRRQKLAPTPAQG